MERRTILLSMGGELRDERWLREGGDFAAQFRAAGTAQVEIDFSELMWGDPVPLLSLGCLAAEYREQGGKLTINLGRARVDNRFLIFLAQHGFLDALATGSRVLWSDRSYEPGDLAPLEADLRNLPGVLAYQDAECIPAQIFSLADLQQGNLDAVVETLVAVAHSRVAGWLRKKSRRLNLMLYELRLFLVEALDNISEHAYSSSTGYGAVYARIRAGIPEEQIALRAWKLARARETANCPALNRCDVGKRPGWLELFVCDVGLGLDYGLKTGSKAPLAELSNRIFREPVSRYDDRSLAGKTSMTGLQRIGELLSAGAKVHGRGDFVRIYSSGEWIGEHLPWTEQGLLAGRRNVRGEVNYPEGVVLHFAIEPPPAEAQQQLSLYPRHFNRPTASSLANVRAALSVEGEASGTARYDFVDLFLEDTGRPLRTKAALDWTTELTEPIVMVRPSVTQRKIDLVKQIESVIKNHGKLSTLIFVDLPWSAAIDFSNIVDIERYWKTIPSRPINLFILSQDWICAGFKNTYSPVGFVPDIEATENFVAGSKEVASAALVASALKERDSALFWMSVERSYINEPILWSSAAGLDSTEIWGYLDLTLALSTARSYAAARRSLRRAISAFAGRTVYVGDELIYPLVTGEFEAEDAEAALASARPAGGVLVGSVSATGSTTRKLLGHRSSHIRGRVQLLQHPDLVRPNASNDEVVALAWRPPTRALRTTRRLFSRIPNTPFVIRGGEASVPLPRFSAPDGPALGRSLYGETPGSAYREWQRVGFLRMGHWVYGLNHDLLTLRLMDVVEFDAAAGGSLAGWFAEQLQEWVAELKKDQGCIVVYPHHAVTDRLVREVRKQLPNDRVSFYPTSTIRVWSQSPIVISPMTREAIAEDLEANCKGGARVVFLDDALITGRTFSQVTHALEGLWEIMKSRGRLEPAAELVISSLAIVDRTAAPAQRSLVIRDQPRHRRFWRWDVPTLGHAGACPLCGLRGRWSEMASVLTGESLRLRLQHWLELWAPVQVEGGRFDVGVDPRPMPAGSRTRFAVERGPAGEIAHTIDHLVSTSKVAIGIEIARSTTRKDYPLRKARSGAADSPPIDLETRIEMVGAQMLLLYDSLSAYDRVDRLQLLLDLLWECTDLTITSAFAGLLLQLDTALTREVWGYCEGLIEERGIPHDDALIAAIALHHSTGRPRLRVHGNSDWELFDLCREAPNRYREPLAMVFRVFGWSPNSVHANLLPDLLRRTQHSPKDLRQTALMLEQLAAALARIIPLITEGTDLTPGEDQKPIKALAADLQVLSVWDAPSDAERRRKTQQTLDEAFSALFSVGGFQSRYTTALTLRIDGETTASAVLGPMVNALKEGWERLLEEKGRKVSESWPRKPEIGFGTSALLPKGLYLYFDMSVKRAVAELLSNVAHRRHPIASPWPDTADFPEADMWIRLIGDEDGSGVVIESVNGAVTTRDARPQTTSNLFHLEALGGGLSTSYDPKNHLYTMRLRIPTLAGLSKYD